MDALTEVTIERKQQGKGREFSATCLAYVTADKLWEGGTGGGREIARPVWATFLGSDDELRPFAANLALGRRALVSNNNYNRAAKGFEFLKSAGYKQLWQREAEGSILTVFLPELFLLDPGMVDPKEAKFVVLPPRGYAEKQEIASDEIVRHARRLPIVKQLNAMPERSWERERWTQPFPAERVGEMVATSYLFAAYLDRRTRAPIPPDGRFYLQLLFACLDAKIASWQHDGYYNQYHGEFGRGANFGFVEKGTDVAGLLPGVAFSAAHDVIEELLAREIALFFKMTRGK